MDDLARHSTQGIILSRGKAEKNLTSYVNEKPNKYVIEQMRLRIFKLASSSSINLRENFNVFEKEVLH